MEAMEPEARLERLLEDYRAAGHAGEQAPLVQLLREVQAEPGGLTPGRLDRVAEAAGVKRTYLDAIIRRFPSLRAAPGKTAVVLCLGPRCCKRGAQALLPALEERLGTKAGRYAADGRYRLDIRFCMKKCGCGPNLTVDGELHTGVTPERLEELFPR